MYYFDLSMGILLKNEEKIDPVKAWVKDYFARFLSDSDALASAVDTASSDSVISLEQYAMGDKEGSYKLSAQVENGEFAKELVSRFMEDLTTFWVSLDDVCMGAGKIEDGALYYVAGNPEGFVKNRDHSGMKLTGNADIGFEADFFGLFDDGDEDTSDLTGFIMDIRYGE